MKYSEWEPGLEAPEGYRVARYHHCESCEGHEYLEPDSTQDVVVPREIKLFGLPKPPGYLNSRRKYFHDKGGGKL